MQRKSLKQEELFQEACIIREAYQITGEHQENQEERSEYQGFSRKTRGGAKGSTLPEDMRLYRYDLVEALLKAGIPLSKVDSLRQFLEKYGHRLTSRTRLGEFIPLIRQKEIDSLKSEIAANSAFSVIFERLEKR